jgi:hypothetical protein
MSPKPTWMRVMLIPGDGSLFQIQRLGPKVMNPQSVDQHVNLPLGFTHD